MMLRSSMWLLVMRKRKRVPLVVIALILYIVNASVDRRASWRCGDIITIETTHIVANCTDKQYADLYQTPGNT